MEKGGSLEALLGAAAAARQHGNAAEELALLERALQAAPGDPRALNARGMRALADRAFEQARDCFAAAAAADPEQPALRMNVATACRALADDAGEQAALERALDINRLNFTALLRLAELHQRRGDAVEAVKSWTGVVQMAAGMGEPPPAVAEAVERGRAFLARQNEAMAALLDGTFGPDLAALGSRGRRFGACIDHMLGRRAIYQNQCASLLYPFLPADEFFDRECFPWLPRIEARTDVIRDEALALLAAGSEAIRPYVRQEPGTPQNKWSPLDHSLEWSACFLWEYGEPNEAVRALCPETAAALEAIPRNHIPGKAPSAFFSILRPGARIPPHTGVTNTRAIIHLPLVVPPGCGFRVGGETREWKVGETFAFDDTIEHEAWNTSSDPRIVLIFDVWNPHLSREEQELLVRFFEVTANPVHR